MDTIEDLPERKRLQVMNHVRPIERQQLDALLRLEELMEKLTSQLVALGAGVTPIDDALNEVPVGPAQLDIEYTIDESAKKPKGRRK